MAQPRHKRDSAARLFARHAQSPKVAAPVVALAMTAVVGVGALLNDPEPSAPPPASAAAAEFQEPVNVAERETVVSRSEARDAARDAAYARREARTQEERREKQQQAVRATAQAVASADTRLWATSNLNIWPDSGAQKDRLGLIDAGDKVLVTGRKADGRVEVVLQGRSRWVTAGYLSDEKPVSGSTPGTGGTCTNGTSVAGGVSGNIVNVHRTVCARFPEISVYGTLRGGGGDHPLGRAVDIMVSGSRGWQVAEYVRANAGALGVTYVIYSQRIWSVERSGEGWRAMSDRGSTTANHYDHVHVSTY